MMKINPFGGDTQIGRVYASLADGKWRAVVEISSLTGDVQTSVSAQLRHLRKPQNGNYLVVRRRCAGSSRLSEYSLVSGKQ